MCSSVFNIIIIVYFFFLFVEVIIEEGQCLCRFLVGCIFVCLRVIDPSPRGKSRTAADATCRFLTHLFTFIYIDIYVQVATNYCGVMIGLRLQQSHTGDIIPHCGRGYCRFCRYYTIHIRIMFPLKEATHIRIIQIHSFLVIISVFF